MNDFYCWFDRNVFKSLYTHRATLSLASFTVLAGKQKHCLCVAVNNEEKILEFAGAFHHPMPYIHNLGPTIPNGAISQAWWTTRGSVNLEDHSTKLFNHVWFDGTGLIFKMSLSFIWENLSKESVL